MTSFLRRACFITACLGACASPGAAAELRPSWECLPEETAVMIRMPQGAEFVEMLRSRTKFGAVLLGQRRVDKAWALLIDRLGKAGTGEQFRGLDEAMARYGLEADDMRNAFAGDAGLAVVVQPRQEGMKPFLMMLGWLEPGPETAERMLAAVKQKLDEDAAKNGDQAARRIDMEVAGRDVVWTVAPVMQLDIDASDLELEDAGEAGPDGGLERRMEEIRRRIETAKPVQTGQAHAFITRIGGRLLAGWTAPGNGPREQRPRAENRDFDLESGTEEARALATRFLAAHAQQGDSPLAARLDTPGIRNVLPGGMPLLDVVVDPRVFITAYAADNDALLKGLRDAGADAVGPLAWRQSFDRGCYQSTLAAALPAPRRGLLRILDQDCDSSEVPAFVSREAVDLTQISLDLAKAYQTVREFAVNQGGEETGNMFTAVEMQAQGWIGVDLPGVLGALGSRHWLISYPPRVAEAMEESRRAARAGAAAGQGIAADRTAFVWQIADEAPFLKILQRLATMVNAEIGEEQGFRGVRLPNGAAAFVGRGHLVIGVGADSLERTLAAIRTPPTGESSFRESAAIRRAGELLPLDPARMFGVSDCSRSGGTLGMLRELAAALTPEDVGDDYRDLLADLQAMLPSGTDMEGMMGTGAMLMTADDDGIALRSVWEMPAP
jgi:hypothetical protein